MPTVFSHLASTEVDTSSEAWRHECECRWLLTAKPTRSEKHAYLYGVSDRSMLFRFDQKTGKIVLRDDIKSLWPRDERNRIIKPLMEVRSLEAADRILEDARRLYTLSQPTRESA